VFGRPFSLQAAPVLPASFLPRDDFFHQSLEVGAPAALVAPIQTYLGFGPQNFVFSLHLYFASHDAMPNKWHRPSPRSYAQLLRSLDFSAGMHENQSIGDYAESSQLRDHDILQDEKHRYDRC
jgi:hypothetical protein